MSKYIRTLAIENPAALATSAELAVELSGQTNADAPVTTTLSAHTMRALRKASEAHAAYLANRNLADEARVQSAAFARFEILMAHLQCDFLEGR